jgi:hypothetical protein
MGKPQSARGEIENEAMFARFWTLYPRRTAKAAARAAWGKLEQQGLVSDEWLTVVENALDRQRRARDQRAARGDRLADWPHPATWLNGGRWEDEVHVERTAPPLTHGERGCSVEGCGRTADVLCEGRGWCAWHWSKHVNPDAIANLYANLRTMGMARGVTESRDTYADRCREYARDGLRVLLARGVRSKGGAGFGKSLGSEDRA